MIMQLTKYCIVRFNPLEIKIIMEAFKEFNPKTYDVEEPRTRILKRSLSKKEREERHKRLQNQFNNPTRKNYEDLLEDFTKYYTYTETGRFYHAHFSWDKERYDSYGKDKDVRLWQKDPQILYDVVQHYNKIKKINKKPKNLIENKSMLIIYKHHVTKLIEELKQIRDAMKVNKIWEMGYD